MFTSTSNIAKARHRRFDEEARAAALEQLHMISVGGSDEDCRDRR
jgi:hypothetical protein